LLIVILIFIGEIKAWLFNSKNRNQPDILMKNSDKKDIWRVITEFSAIDVNYTDEYDNAMMMTKLFQ